MEEMKLFQMNTALVKRNIEYDCLVQRCRLGEQQQLDEIVALIVETISIERENITISGVKYPYQFVKSRLLLLEESHIEYVLDCLHENTREVKNMHRRNAMQEVPELKGLSETCNRIYKLQDVDVLFQCLLMDQMDWEEGKLYVQFSTVYLLLSLRNK